MTLHQRLAMWRREPVLSPVVRFAARRQGQIPARRPGELGTLDGGVVACEQRERVIGLDRAFSVGQAIAAAFAHASGRFDVNPKAIRAELHADAPASILAVGLHRKTMATHRTARADRP
jgi:hypothetical protein